MTTALNVAYHIVKKARKISALKLQQILYCVWREYGRQTGDILFWEPFSAKLNGPVCQEVYDAFCFAGDETSILIKAAPLDAHIAAQMMIFCAEGVFYLRTSTTLNFLLRFRAALGSVCGMMDEEKMLEYRSRTLRLTVLI